jgi:hypothetical protein
MYRYIPDSVVWGPEISLDYSSTNANGGLNLLIAKKVRRDAKNIFL